MKATELRLGNLIYNTKGEVDTVNIDALKYLLNYPILYQTKPIYLTEKWLKKVEFQLKKKNEYYINSFFFIENNCLFYSNDFTGVTIKYVHQLQNLYFVLTGEELTFNDNEI